MATKPKEMKGHRYARTRAVSLPLQARRHFISLTGVEGAKRDALIAGLESDIAQLRAQRESVDDGPTPAGRAVTLRRIEKAARELKAALLDLSEMEWIPLTDVMDEPIGIFDLNGPHVEELTVLVDAAKNLRAELLKTVRRGRTGRPSIYDEAVQTLGHRYRRFASSPDREDQINFVRAGLAAIRLRPIDDEKLRRMIRAEDRARSNGRR